MSRTKKNQLVRDTEHEQSVLNKPVNLDGSGEDAAVRAVLSSEFSEMPDSGAVQVAAALQQIIRGQQFMTDNMGILSEAMSKIMDRVERMEKAQEAYENDQKAFLDEARKRGDAVRADNPDAKSKALAVATQRLSTFVAQSKARRGNQQREQIRLLEEEPVVEITSPGVVVLVSTVEGPSPQITSDFVRVGSLVWELKPGVCTKLPASVAAQYYENIRLRDELQQRSAAMEIKDGVMGSQHEQGAIINKQHKIDQQFGTAQTEIPFAVP